MREQFGDRPLEGMHGSTVFGFLVERPLLARSEAAAMLTVRARTNPVHAAARASSPLRDDVTSLPRAQ
jgi:hypothetical protein